MDCIKHIIKYKYEEKVSRVILDYIYEVGMLDGYNDRDTRGHGCREVGIHNCKIDDITTLIDAERVKFIIYAETTISIYRSRNNRMDCEMLEWYEIEASVDFDLDDFQILYVGVSDYIMNYQDTQSYGLVL